MISLKGKLINFFEAPKGETKEGREYGGDCKIQVLGDISLQNGETKCDLVTLTAHDIADFKDHVGKEISIPIGVFVNGKNAAFFIPRGSKPEIFKTAASA
ncbi:putative uncharacterized protein (plasmid) [Aliivibrio wodanis]|uniref:Uncharacterized protein n=1 Tax=Aliivibrio wodanis TaxID=80852 RepID=A0A090IBX0_9GAMM|nr:putative uncharacterized protein [Aliivibrio wodanis]